MYLIAIIEHQSDVYYDMAFKLFRYIVMVLTDYEVEQFTDLIGRREFGMMFDSFEAYDVQEIRRISRAEGDMIRIITLTLKKLAKNHSVPEIADMLEEDEALIQRICNIKAAHPDSNEEEVWNLLCNEQEES